MTYRVFSGSARWIQLAIPLFLIVSVFMIFAFRGSIATAKNEEPVHYTEKSSMELTYYGYNP